MSDEAYWTYKASTPTPTWIEALWVGAINSTMTEKQWNSLTPGMRREIVMLKVKKTS